MSEAKELFLKEEGLKWYRGASLRWLVFVCEPQNIQFARDIASLLGNAIMLHDLLEKLLSSPS